MIPITGFHLENNNEKFLFCRALKITMIYKNIMVVNSFFENEDLQMKNKDGEYIYGASAVFELRLVKS